MIKQRFLDAFKQISDIPHPSGYTEKLLNFLINYANERNLKTIENNGNVIVTIPATKGLENLAPVIIQAHFDMVAEKTADSDHDFYKDSLKLKIDGDKLYAENTTLGGDDGAGIAYMMMLMEENCPHPELFLVFTRDEEIGILGALDLDVAPLLSARYMINLDTEAEGYLTIGAGGGEAVESTLKVQREEKNGDFYQIEVSGLTGGHSGAILENNRAYAAKILVQALSFLRRNCGIQILSLDCGGQDNVITSKGKAVVVAPSGVDVIQNFNLIAEMLTGAYSRNEPDIALSILPVDKPETSLNCLDIESTRNVLHTIEFMPTGLLIQVDGNPRASANIGLCQLTDTELKMRTHFRFNSESYREMVKNLIISLLDYVNAEYIFDKYSPAWEVKDGGELQKMTVDLFKQTTGQNIIPIDVHGTVEGGVFSKKIPHLEIVSFGATVSGIHTPKETLLIPSAVRVYEFLVKLLGLFNEDNDSQLDSEVILKASENGQITISEN